MLFWEYPTSKSPFFPETKWETEQSWSLQCNLCTLTVSWHSEPAACPGSGSLTLVRTTKQFKQKQTVFHDLLQGTNDLLSGPALYTHPFRHKSHLLVLCYGGDWWHLTHPSKPTPGLRQAIFCKAELITITKTQPNSFTSRNLISQGLKWIFRPCKGTVAMPQEKVLVAPSKHLTAWRRLKCLHHLCQWGKEKDTIQNWGIPCSIHFTSF